MSDPHCSGVLTISLVIFLHDRQTNAQATTSLRAGQVVWLASTRWIISWSSSGGMFAHRRLCWTNDAVAEAEDEHVENRVVPHSAATWDFPWYWCVCLLLDMSIVNDLLDLKLWVVSFCTSHRRWLRSVLSGTYTKMKMLLMIRINRNNIIYILCEFF